MQRGSALGDFLRTRRDRLQPGDIGLASSSRRRAPGLRRSDVAERTGISVDYYMRMEQGRDVHPSVSVVESLADALLLTDDERGHLFALARSERVPPRGIDGTEVRPAMRQLLKVLGPAVPGIVIGPRLEILAWNDVARTLLTDFTACRPTLRNIAWHSFCDPVACNRYVDWEQMAREEIAHLRLAHGRYPDDAALRTLIEELSERSEHFRRWWPQHEVADRGHGMREFNHPLTGRLTLRYESFGVAGSDQRLVTYMAPHADSAAGLARLANVAL